MRILTDAELIHYRPYRPMANFLKDSRLPKERLKKEKESLTELLQIHIRGVPPLDFI